MRNTLVYVNDQLIDLYPGTLIAFTYQNTFLSNLSTRRSSYTNEITVPFTPTNDIIFGFARLEKSDAGPAYRRLSAKIIRNGYTLPLNNCQIYKTDNDYKLRFFDSFKEFMEVLGDSTIDELKEVDTEFVTWDVTEIDSRRNSSGGLVAPVINHGQVSTQVLNNPDFTTDSDGDFIEYWEQVKIYRDDQVSTFNDKEFADDGTFIHAELNSYAYDDGAGVSFEQPGGTVLLRQPYKFYAGQTYTVTLRHSYNAGGAGTPTRGKLILLKDVNDRLGKIVLDEESATSATTDTATFTPVDGTDTPTDYEYIAVFGFLPAGTPSGSGNTDTADFQVYSVSITLELNMTNFANLPAVYYKSIFQAIYEKNNYNVEQTSLFSDDIYTNLIVPFSKEKFEYTGFFNKCREFEAEIRTPVTVSSDDDLVFETITKKDLFGFYNPTTGIYDSDGTGAYQALETWDARPFYASFYAVLEITLISGSVDFSIRSQNFNDMVEQTVSSPGRYTIKLFANQYPRNDGGLEKFNVISGDTVYVHADFTSAGSFIVHSGKFYNVVDGTNQAETDPEFYACEILPDMKQKDFVTDLIMRFGIVPFEKNRTLVFKSLEEVISDRFSALDWTNKRDKSVKDEITYNNQYAKNNYFTYPSQEEIFDEKIVRGNIQIDNENLSDEAVIYDSKFNGSTDISVDASSSNIYIGYIPTWESAKVKYPTATNEGYDFDNDTGLRIMVVRSKRSAEPNVVYNGNARSDYLIANFLKPDARELAWEENILRFYNRAKKSIQIDKSIVREYTLTEADLAQVHPHKIIYDSGSYFWIEKISNHIDSEPVKVQLYKIV